MADHLLERKCALVVVTHDRWFLDTVCNRTWEVVDGRVEQYEGGYADWVYARAERARLAQQAEELGVEIFPGFPAAEVLYTDDGKVRRFATYYDTAAFIEPTA